MLRRLMVWISQHGLQRRHHLGRILRQRRLGKVQGIDLVAIDLKITVYCFEDCASIMVNP